MKKLVLLLTALLGSCAAAHALNTIIVDKPALMLHVLSERGDTLMSAPVAVGTNRGDKQRRGDHRTPEGSFSICQIQDSSRWSHDFGDGRGMTPGAYGPYFFRIRHPKWHSIGIHGTCFPESVGTRASEGCVRLRNADLRRLRPYISIGTPVIIRPDRN